MALCRRSALPELLPTTAFLAGVSGFFLFIVLGWGMGEALDPEGVAPLAKPGIDPLNAAMVDTAMLSVDGAKGL